MREATDYREILNAAFQARKDRNSAYSMRSFARDLSLSPSMLSEVLSCKKNLTRKSAEKIAIALNLSQHEATLFLLSVDLENPRAGTPAESTRDKMQLHNCYGKTIDMKAERLAFIADPRHLVLMSMIELGAFTNSLSWVAKQLGIFQHEANRLFKTLRNLKIIRSTPGNKVELEHNYLFCSEANNAEAVRNFHRATLATAVDALVTVPLNERDYYTSIFAFDQNDFGAIQNDIREFHKALYAKYSEKATADRVYAVQNQFIPQTPRIKSCAS